MFKLKWDDIYLNGLERQITYEFEEGKIYAIFAPKNLCECQERIFYYLTRVEKIKNGKMYINKIDIDYFEEEIYLTNIVTIIDNKRFICKKTLFKYLKFISNNFRKIRERNIDIELCIEVLKDILKEFECEEQLLKKRVSNLDAKEKLVAKIIECLILDSKILIIYNFGEESLNSFLKYLHLLTTKYRRCVLLFTNSEDEDMLSHFDEIVCI